MWEWRAKVDKLEQKLGSAYETKLRVLAKVKEEAPPRKKKKEEDTPEEVKYKKEIREGQERSKDG